jgi:hypothetical protein
MPTPRSGPQRDLIMAESDELVIHISNQRNRHERSHRSQRPTQTNPVDEVKLWHRLYGTLLSSQETDAHQLRPSGHPRGNPSNLDSPQRLGQIHRGGDDRGFEESLPQPVDRQDLATSSVELLLGSAGGTVHLFGVRSSLPGDMQNIT